MGPNDLIFFSSENSDLTGFDGRNFYRQHSRNFYLPTSEIQKYGPNLAQIFRFSVWNLLPSEISDASKILFFQKYDSSASFCTSNQGQRSQLKKSQISVKSKFANFEKIRIWFWDPEMWTSVWDFVKIRKLRLTEFFDFLSYDLDSRCKMKLKSHIFPKIKFWARQKFLVATNLRPKIWDFGPILDHFPGFQRSGSRNF